MKYQVLKMNGTQLERIAIITADNRLEANSILSAKAKEMECILYLSYYSEAHPQWHDGVIATATHLGDIINY